MVWGWTLPLLSSPFSLPYLLSLRLEPLHASSSNLYCVTPLLVGPIWIFQTSSVAQDKRDGLRRSNDLHTTLLWFCEVWESHYCYPPLILPPHSISHFFSSSPPFFSSNPKGWGISSSLRMLISQWSVSIHIHQTLQQQGVDSFMGKDESCSTLNVLTSITDTESEASRWVETHVYEAGADWCPWAGCRLMPRRRVHCSYIYI